MRLQSTLFLGLGILLCFPPEGSCCSPYGAKLPASVKLPGTVDRAIVRAGHLYAVTGNGHLIAVDLKQNAVRDYGTFEMKLLPHIDVIGERACIASQNRVYLVDLKKGRLIHAAVFEQDVRGLGFLCDERVYVQTGSTLDVLNVASGKTTRLADQTFDDMPRRMAGVACTVAVNPFCPDASKCLVAALTCEKSCLAIIDAASGKKIDEVPAPELRSDSGLRAVRGLLLAGDKVFVLRVRFSYGVWTDSLGIIDLKTRKYNALKLPNASLGETSLVAGPNHTVLLTGSQGTFQYGADGQLIGRVLENSAGRLVGIWNGSALVAGPESLQVFPLARPAGNYVR